LFGSKAARAETEFLESDPKLVQDRVGKAGFLNVVRK
jgi:hypothetical protein